MQDYTAAKHDTHPTEDTAPAQWESSTPRLVWRMGLIAMAVVAIAGCNNASGDASSTQATPVVAEESSDGVDGSPGLAEQPEAAVPETEPSDDGVDTEIDIGAPFEDTCTIAWPTAPSRSSQGTQIRTTCRGVDAGEYQFVDILVLDPDLEVTPSDSTVRVRGEVVDVIESEMGFTTLAVIATEAEIV